MLVFCTNNCVSAIKRMLFYYRHISIFVFFHVFVFLVTAMHAWVYSVVCGSEDVIKYSNWNVVTIGFGRFLVVIVDSDDGICLSTHTSNSIFNFFCRKISTTLSVSFFHKECHEAEGSFIWKSTQILFLNPHVSLFFRLFNLVFNLLRIRKYWSSRASCSSCWNFSSSHSDKFM